jgi:hypothetical protein
MGQPAWQGCALFSVRLELWRSTARFSRTRSSREWKALTNQPRKCRSDTIMARIVAEKSESSFSQVIHSAGVRRFGEAQRSPLAEMLKDAQRRPVEDRRSSRVDCGEARAECFVFAELPGTHGAIVTNRSFASTCWPGATKSFTMRPEMGA